MSAVKSGAAPIKPRLDLLGNRTIAPGTGAHTRGVGFCCQDRFDVRGRHRAESQKSQPVGDGSGCRRFVSLFAKIACRSASREGYPLLPKSLGSRLIQHRRLKVKRQFRPMESRGSLSDRPRRCAYFARVCNLFTSSPAYGSPSYLMK